MEQKKKYYIIAGAVVVALIAVAAYYVVVKKKYGSDAAPAAVIYQTRDELLLQIKALEEKEASAGLNWQDTFRLGVMYSHVGRTDDAFKAFTKSAGMHPYVKSYESIGMIHYTKLQYDDAIKAWEKAIELAPVGSEHLKDLIGRAKTGKHMSRRTESLEEKRKKNGSLTWQESFELGIIYLNIRRFDDALTHLNEAVKTKDGKKADVYDTLARVYTFKGEYAKAIEAEKKAIELDPKQKVYKTRLEEIIKFEKAVKAAKERASAISQRPAGAARKPKPAAPAAAEPKPAASGAK